MLQRLNGLLMQAGIVITDTQKTQLVQLVELLHKWNKAYNLTSVRDPDAMLVKHILDSLVVSPHLHGERFIDVGTGPGLPGLPLAIINPDKQFVLLDSLGKRINFIRQVIQELGLTNVTPVKSRVEEYQPDVGFDCVLSRAFASLEDMLSWCHHLPSEQGSFLALKGQYPEQELAQLPANIRLVACHELRVPELEGERHLLEFKHIQPE
ncbi:MULTISPECIES: 16S rRNA (guanine(527)-N(7))-methyltransferase RsmG [Aeromonas]|jgi:16S rRNA (guanine527-N7)-methyltransferase|uniref:Ribosomal RNA small subunit methyltransferase G n=5 Tax=Bacteria TaxID=2 RepID=A0A3L0W297_ECOLX|nr:MULTISPECIES: 16S rRNA (guanine(527)-N(7))-methyltransferase RsmG [Aeromonas]ELI6432886.1 16S rRNA (guanine(527)-N(7))-methyltransferase RsmG [Aeromonas salmonicida subsp. salmonicida]MBP6140862.1 16S rRNA (guanine(527)-N(7))-methyltransferase RsmG [Aeromonas sp.]ARW84400.1 16S rRNA (guanine(527)-N(7))-methyltransferase [Aeromonas salmonicida]ATP11564.1 16S rRNA (guanine(527)-N(7))-methyltransferase RsmG [Aeromonas salmonicida subsp. pectinolytica 34mel]ATU99844.1 16S rRNA (guanine(527)-N(7